jgi:protein-L-isoaspartate(D-aspartate) O-methyltransferase
VSALRQDQLVEVVPGWNEPAAAVERDRTPVLALHNRPERAGALRDGEALRELEQLPPDSLGLVGGADQELLDADAVAGALDCDVARGRTLDLGDEHGVRLEHAERADVVPGLLIAERALGQPEEMPLVLGPERSDLGLPVRHRAALILALPARLSSRCSGTASRAHTAPVEPLVAAATAAGVRDRRVLDALERVQRAAYVPAHLRDRADVDEPLPIPRDQVTTQPSLVAKMVEALALGGSERVLEVGTGYGFQTAVLARLAAYVFSVERYADLAETARENLEREGVVNVEILVGDGSSGLPERAPFDAILVSAAFPTVAPPLAEQLAEGGRLVQPIGRGGSEEVTLFQVERGRLVLSRSITGARFVPLIGQHGFPVQPR